MLQPQLTEGVAEPVATGYGDSATTVGPRDLLFTAVRTAHGVRGYLRGFRRLGSVRRVAKNSALCGLVAFTVRLELQGKAGAEAGALG